MGTNLFWIYDALQPLERTELLLQQFMGKKSSVCAWFYFMVSDQKIYPFQKKKVCTKMELG